IICSLSFFELLQAEECLDAEFLRRVLISNIGSPPGQFGGVIHVGKRLVVTLGLNKAVGENRKKSDQACGVPRLCCKLQCCAYVFPGSLQITVIECRNSKLR